MTEKAKKKKRFRVNTRAYLIKKMLENMAKNGDEMTIDSVFKRVNRMHWVLLFVSLLASIAGVLTAHLGPGV